MRIDLNKIPRDRPCAVHIPTLEHGIAFVNEMKEHYPDAVVSWPKAHYWESRLTTGGNYYFPRLHESRPYMTHGSKDTYIGMGVTLLSFEDVLIPDVELETTLGDMSIESLFG